MWGRPVTDPEAERAAEAAENAQPLDTTRRDVASTAAAREAEVARLRAEQRAWWDAELAKAREQTHGHAARPVSGVPFLPSLPHRPRTLSITLSNPQMIYLKTPHLDGRSSQDLLQGEQSSCRGAEYAALRVHRWTFRTSQGAATRTRRTRWSTTWRWTWRRRGCGRRRTRDGT